MAYKRKKKAPKKQPSKPKISRSPAVFERAFKNRVGQTPEEFIEAKLSVGSDINATRYLYEITAAAIAQQNNCIAWDFDRFYKEEVSRVPKVTKYNTLVRDGVPDSIRATGKQRVTETLDNAKYIELLDVKLRDGVGKYQKNPSLEGLADILEVMGAIVDARGYTWEQLTDARKEKRAKYGAYEKRILLKEVIE